MIGTKHQRKLRKFSDGFIEKFRFFLQCRRSGIINFCGEGIIVKFDIDSSDGMDSFRMFEDGQFSKGKRELRSRHSNVLKCVIEGKKGWGLWLNEWTTGISECNFTKEDILNEFHQRQIKIPESLLLDFGNRLEKKRLKRIDDELLRLKNFL